MQLVLRSKNFQMAQSVRDKVEASIQKVFSRFGKHIDQLEVSLRDVEGEGGEPVKEATFTAHVMHAGRLFIDSRGKDYADTIHRAAERMGSRLKGYLQSHRLDATSL